jgi:hypothetical protein
VTDHISDLRWDRWLAGELSADETAASLAHAEQCARCGDRMRELSIERDRFRERPIPIAFARARRAPRWIAGGAMTLVAAAAVLVLVLRAGPDPDGDRTKGAGGPSLIVAGGKHGVLVPLSTGDVIHPGDSLQVGYTSERDGFGALISRDGAAAVTAYVPAQGPTLAPLPAGTDREFPQSTTLDAVVGTEVLYIVWCPTALPLAPLLAEVTRGELGAHPGCHHRKLVLEKRNP